VPVYDAQAQGLRIFLFFLADAGAVLFSFLSLPQANSQDPAIKAKQAWLMRLAKEQRQRQRGISEVSVFENNAAQH
jgi:hypothetical protein